MKHVTVYSENEVFAGWPANHGAWQWGDELLFGFIRGQHNIGGMHNVRGRLEKVLARSLDGGDTWKVEVPSVDFEAESPMPAPKFDLSTVILRACGWYDHGGEKCHEKGGFYISADRGKEWSGPFFFDGIDLPSNKIATSRTCVLDGIVFLSAASRDHWGSDFTYCCTHDGGKFVGKSIVLNDDARAVMPAAAKVKGRIVVAMRRLGRGRLGGWIDSVFSDDGGETWSMPVHVAETGRDNGNPPAIVEADGRLYCAYANRSDCAVHVNASEDGAYSWKPYARLRKGNAPDIGYPRLFRRSDGNLVCVYYWTEKFEQPQRIEATIFAAH